MRKFCLISYLSSFWGNDMQEREVWKKLPWKTSGEVVSQALPCPSRNSQEHSWCTLITHPKQMLPYSPAANSWMSSGLFKNISLENNKGYGAEVPSCLSADDLRHTCPRRQPEASCQGPFPVWFSFKSGSGARSKEPRECSARETASAVAKWSLSFTRQSFHKTEARPGLKSSLPRPWGSHMLGDRCATLNLPRKSNQKLPRVGRESTGNKAEKTDVRQLLARQAHGHCDNTRSAGPLGSWNCLTSHGVLWLIKQVHKYYLTLQPCETAMTMPHFTQEETKLSKGWPFAQVHKASK